MEHSGDYIIIIMRSILPAEEFELELPATTTGAEIKQELFDPQLGLNFPLVDNDGNKYEYKIIHKTTGKEIPDSKTLKECKVRDGDVLILNPTVIGIGMNSRPILDIPSSIDIDVPVTLNVQMDLNAFSEFRGIHGFNEVLNSGRENNDLVIIELEESPRPCYLKIECLSKVVHLIDDNCFIEYDFNVNPIKPGVATIILRVLLADAFGHLGYKKKKVVYLSIQEITINGAALKKNLISPLPLIDEWENTKNEAYRYITKSEVGKALATLNNYFQSRNMDFCHEVILLHSTWTEGKSQTLLGAITTTDWLMIQTRVTQGALGLIKKSEEGGYS